mmetsp:Transcript_18967/g.49348  ORF Transcript_18967/g.49348 Transcript_18967/m.49348 type:complete len:277 (-) Transcript_18967:834-1664(-)
MCNKWASARYSPWAGASGRYPPTARRGFWRSPRIRGGAVLSLPNGSAWSAECGMGGRPSPCRNASSSSKTCTYFADRKCLPSYSLSRSNAIAIENSPPSSLRPRRRSSSCRRRSALPRIGRPRRLVSARFRMAQYRSFPTIRLVVSSNVFSYEYVSTSPEMRSFISPKFRDTLVSTITLWRMAGNATYSIIDSTMCRVRSRKILRYSADPWECPCFIACCELMKTSSNGNHSPSRPASSSRADDRMHVWIATDRIVLTRFKATARWSGWRCSNQAR